MIDKWKSLLSLNDWIVITESIDPKSVTYSSDCPAEDRYYIGVSTKSDIKTATIYHDRPLTERDVIHELLHVRYPNWTEEMVNEVEELLYNIKKDE